NPDLPGNSAERVRQAAMAIFKAVDGYGLSRVDFFVTEDGEVVFNEINTLPGFTAISMYPMLFAAVGIEKKELVTKLIEHGLKRYER
ncbi:MAG: ATP-grasp domain-containing protein, partial [Clostridium sp.]|nr:ATP-grasp domain-containing protein [Clostridium sp.]